MSFKGDATFTGGAKELLTSNHLKPYLLHFKIWNFNLAIGLLTQYVGEEQR